MAIFVKPPDGWTFDQALMGYRHTTGKVVYDTQRRAFGDEIFKVALQKPQPQPVQKVYCSNCKELMVKVYPWAGIRFNWERGKPLCSKCLHGIQS